MGKIDEAIKVLMSYWGVFKTDCGYEYVPRADEDIGQILGIIALLEAAGRVDKDELEFILGILDDQSYYADKGKTVIALLKALPD